VRVPRMLPEGVAATPKQILEQEKEQIGAGLTLKRIALAVLVVVLVSLPLLINANQFRPMLESKLSHGLGREVNLGDLKFSVLSGGVTTSDLSIVDHPAFCKSPFMRAKSLTVSAELWPFIFSRKLNVTGLTIDQPDIVLLQSVPGQWNFSNRARNPWRLRQTPRPQAAAINSICRFN